MTDMKLKNTLIISLLLCAFCSCENFLDTVNEKEVGAHEELDSLDALCATTANLYTSPWYFFHKQRFLQLGDARANNFYISAESSNDYNSLATFNEKKENATISHAWGSLYNVVTQASYVIEDYVPYCVNNGICTCEGPCILVPCNLLARCPYH